MAIRRRWSCELVGVALLLVVGAGCAGSTSPPAALPPRGAVATVLGGTEADFAMRFGVPAGPGTGRAGSLGFAPSAASAHDALTVQLDTGDGAALAQRVVIVALAAPSGRWWRAADARAGRELRADRRPARQTVPLVGTRGAVGMDVLYGSASLARIFPPGAFIDITQGLVAPGSFDIQYRYATPGATGEVARCQSSSARNRCRREYAGSRARACGAEHVNVAGARLRAAMAWLRGRRESAQRKQDVGVVDQPGDCIKA